MESSRKERWQQLQAVFEPGFKQMLLVSLLVHLLVPILYYTPLFPKKAPEKPPVYKVNLVNKPVLNPQAGRPEAVQSKAGSAAKAAPKPKPLPAAKPIPPKPKPAAVKPKPIPKPEPQPVAKPEPKPQPEPKPAPKATPKPAPKPEPKPAVSKAQENALEKRLEQLRAAQKQKDAEAARQSTLDRLRAAAKAESSRIESPVTNAPVGMLDGKGDEAGVSAVAFVQEYIQQNWSYSKYMATGNPEAEVKVAYDKSGTFLTYDFIRKSGDKNFDDSLMRAIAKSRQLPQPLPQAMTFEIVFNLKEMLDKP